jgi:hypothetical protein
VLYSFSEKELLKGIERDIYSCNKIIWLAQSDLAEKQQECNLLNIGISLLVSECHQLEFELLKAREGRKRNCKTMMEVHAVRVREQEKTLPLQEELKYLCSHMEDLKAHSKCLIDPGSIVAERINVRHWIADSGPGICYIYMYGMSRFRIFRQRLLTFFIKIGRLSYAALQPKTRERQPESNNRETLKQLCKNS